MTQKNNYRIRAATLADVSPGAALQISVWRSAYKGIMPDEFLSNLKHSEFESKWERSIRALDETQLRVVAEREGRIVGFLGGGPCRYPELKRDAELYAIYVDAGLQQQGVGRALLNTYTDWLREHSHRSFMLWVLRENHPARRFYEKLGGVYTGVEAYRHRSIHESLVEISYAWENLN